MAGYDPWSDEERLCLLRSGSFEEFSNHYPDRSKVSWRLKRQALLRGSQPVTGDRRVNNGRKPTCDYQALAAEALAAPAEPAQVRRPPVSHPKGWEPGVVFDGVRGTVTSQPIDSDKPDWSAILEHFNMDAALYEVQEPVQMRTWDAAIGNGVVRQMWYYRASFVRRTAGKADIDEIISLVSQKRPPARQKRPQAAGEPVGYVIALSDWQLGKAGALATAERIMAVLSRIEQHVALLRETGARIENLYLLGLGDVVEGCQGHYDMQTFTVELTRREQVRLARRLIFAYLERLAPMFERVVVAAVPGNHGENRKDGKAFTTFGDNDDVAVFEQLSEALAVNPDRFGHVSFVLPETELTLSLDVHGAILGLAHGHQSAKGGLDGIESWWKGQAFGQQRVGDASVLVTGHFHHLAVKQNGPRTHLQAPTMESGSQWFRERTGIESVPGTLVFTLGAAGWDNLRVLRGD